MSFRVRAPRWHDIKNDNQMLRLNHLIFIVDHFVKGHFWNALNLVNRKTFQLLTIHIPGFLKYGWNILFFCPQGVSG